MLTPYFISFIFYSIYFCYCNSFKNANPSVRTSFGIVQGYYNQNTAVFLAIPYAAPPTGKEKFKKPINPRPWNGTRFADHFAPRCPQAPTEIGPTSEDCLYLNIFTPNLSGSVLLPVIVWVHEGGYESGSGSDYTPNWIISNFVSKGIVFVTFNYRLNFYGFFTLRDIFPPNSNFKEVFPPKFNGEIFPPNRGLWDQLHVLKWVQRNIQQFGGDPTRVTLIGQGSGASCIGFLLYSPLFQGTFHRAVLHNGSPFSPFPAISNFTAHFERNKMILDSLGCDLKLGMEELERCVSSASQGQIWNTWRNIFSKISIENPSDAKWRPTMEGLDGILTLDKTSILKNIQVIIGGVKGEMELDLGKLMGKSLGSFTKEGFNGVVRKLVGPLGVPDLDMVSELAQIVYGNWNIDESETDGWKKAILQIGLRSVQAGNGRNAASGNAGRHCQGKAKGEHSQLITDYALNAGIIKLAKELENESSNKIYLYSSDYSPEKESPVGYSKNSNIKKHSSEHRNISLFLIDSWIQFAKTGNPNVDSSDFWIPFQSDSSQCLSISEKPRKIVNCYRECDLFWNGIISSQNDFTRKLISNNTAILNGDDRKKGKEIYSYRITLTILFFLCIFSNLVLLFFIHRLKQRLRLYRVLSAVAELNFT